jgi:hypothetical protein
VKAILGKLAQNGMLFDKHAKIELTIRYLRILVFAKQVILLKISDDVPSELIVLDGEVKVVRVKFIVVELGILDVLFLQQRLFGSGTLTAKRYLR